MSYRIVGPDGVWRAHGDDALKQNINTLIQRRYSSESGSTERIATARDAILNHPYLEIDNWSCAEQREIQERMRPCRKMLEGLKIRLERGEIRQEGVEGTKGSTSLTPTKLSDRHIRLLDLSENWLLVSIERHPYGGAETVREQYWLYSKKDRSIHLLHDEDVTYPETGPIKVKRGDGPWKDSDKSLEEAFRRVVEDLLGADAMKRIDRNIGSPEDGLCMAPSEVLAKCKAISGIDYEAEEESRRKLREKAYLEKYGPRTHRGSAGIAMAPGIRMVVKKETKEAPTEKRDYNL